MGFHTNTWPVITRHLSSIKYHSIYKRLTKNALSALFAILIKAIVKIYRLSRHKTRTDRNWLINYSIPFMWCLQGNPFCPRNLSDEKSELSLRMRVWSRFWGDDGTMSRNVEDEFHREEMESLFPSSETREWYIGSGTLSAAEYYNASK